MISVKEFADWVATLHPENGIAIDDGGLTVVEIDENNQLTGARFEIGGVPQDDEDEDREFRERHAAGDPTAIAEGEQ